MNDSVLPGQEEMEWAAIFATRFDFFGRNRCWQQPF
jgi:hypothetical protein